MTVKLRRFSQKSCGYEQEKEERKRRKSRPHNCRAETSRTCLPAARITVPPASVMIFSLREAWQTRQDACQSVLLAAVIVHLRLEEEDKRPRRQHALAQARIDSG